jgi:hypothetical protein
MGTQQMEITDALSKYICYIYTYLVEAGNKWKSVVPHGVADIELIVHFKIMELPHHTQTADPQRPRRILACIKAHYSSNLGGLTMVRC